MDICKICMKLIKKKDIISHTEECHKKYQYYTSLNKIKKDEINFDDYYHYKLIQILNIELNLSKKNVICVRYDSQNDKKLVKYKNKGKVYQIVFQKYKGCYIPESLPVQIK